MTTTSSSCCTPAQPVPAAPTSRPAVLGERAGSALVLVGVSHHRAPLAVLEQFAVTSSERPGLLAEVLSSAAVSEALLISTCNRVEGRTRTHRPASRGPTAARFDRGARAGAHAGAG